MDKQNKPRYPLDSDLSGGQCYPPFEQSRPDGQVKLFGMVFKEIQITEELLEIKLL